MLKVSLNDIRDKAPRQDGWEDLLSHLGKTKADNTEVALITVLEVNGMDDALSVLDICVDPHLCRLFAADCAERVLPLFESARPGDTRPRKAIAVARDRNTTVAAAEVAVAAADAALDAAAVVAVAVAAVAAEAAAEAAAGRAVWAVEAAAWVAAEAAAVTTLATWGAAWDVEREAQDKRLRQYLEHGEAAKDMPWPR